MQSKKTVLFLQIIGLIWMFGFGLLIHGLFFTEVQTVYQTITPTPTPAKGHHEYDLLFVEADEPHDIYYIDNFAYNYGYSSSYLYSFADGSWKRVKISPTDINISDAEGRDREALTVSGKIDTAEGAIVIGIPKIKMPMTIRAGSDFIKFGGSTDDKGAYLTIDGQPRSVYAALLKGESTYYPDVDIYRLGVTTNWLMYWDKDWNFYHLDVTNVTKPNPDYPSHELFARISESDDFYATQVDYLKDFNVTNYNRNDEIVNINFRTSKDAPNSALALRQIATTDRPYYTDISYLSAVRGLDGGVGIYIGLDTDLAAD